ncbi:MAG TPA: MerR family transcriptional regulator [Anaerovoracaceae bacterium]|nr:MerR family transcriptional regulator [Anaerovoracaceae bacterium]
MLKYKIGEVSKLLGISIDTLRYYETCGIVKPHRNEETGYRYYDAWDLNFLLDSKRYRSFGFPLSTVEMSMREDNLVQLSDHCVQQERELLEKINHYQMVLQALALYRHRLNHLPEELGKYRIEERSQLIYLRHRFKNEFYCSACTAPLFKQWVELMPFIDHTFEIPFDALYTEVSEENGRYYWGFSMPPQDAIRFGVKLAPPMELIPRRKCYYTVFTAGDKGSFLTDFRKQVLEPLDEREYRACGDPIGHLICRIHEDVRFIRYFEVWVPVE